MTLLVDSLTVVLVVALGVWLGAMAFFSFVAAPTTFRVLGDADAGRVVNEIFPVYYEVGVGLGGLAVVAWAAAYALGAGGTYAVVVPALTLVGVVLHAYARWVLVPKMEAAGDDAFATYHRQSVVLNGVTMLAVLCALAAVEFV